MYDGTLMWKVNDNLIVNIVHVVTIKKVSANNFSVSTVTETFNNVTTDKVKELLSIAGEIVVTI